MLEMTYPSGDEGRPPRRVGAVWAELAMGGSPRVHTREAKSQGGRHESLPPMAVSLLRRDLDADSKSRRKKTPKPWAPGRQRIPQRAHEGLITSIALERFE